MGQNQGESKLAKVHLAEQQQLHRQVDQVISIAKPDHVA